MITVAKATSVEYYTSGSGVAAGMESYYLDAVTDGEPPGRWAGSGAAQLGLAGEVDPEAMKTLYGDFINPVTGERLGRRPAQRVSVDDRLAEALRAEPGATPERVEALRAGIIASQRTNVIGWDLTFAVPKSVTIVHTAARRGEIAALRAGDAQRAERFAHLRHQVEDAIAEANAAGLAAAERVATSRTASGSGGAIQWVDAPGLIVASFPQHTNRSIEPHLHTHNVVLNRAFSADGKVRSLDGQDLLAQRYTFSAVADRALTESLAARLGLAFRDRPDGAGREVALVPEEVIDHFSTRARQTTAAMAPLVAAAEERLGRALTNVETYRLHREAQRSSRAPKTHEGESGEELDDRWLADLIAKTGRSMTSLGDLLEQATRGHVTARLATPAEPDAHDEPASVTSQDQARWSPEAVIAQAIAVCSSRSATWGRANLISELELHLPPVLGIEVDQVPVLLDALADQALASPEVVAVSGTDAGSYAAPSTRLFASTGTLAAEAALRRAAITRGAHALDRAQVSAWLDDHCPDIGADQRAAVEGIAASDAAITVLVGPAGTGKSYAAGALAGAWADLTQDQGRVVGLAVSQVATMVLRDEGIAASRNVAQWLATQDRLTSPDGVRQEDRDWVLGPRDVVMVDEASMVATADLARIRSHVEAAGARLVLTGDPRQLGSVEAGGVMGLLDGHAESYTLTEVRRFHEPWEREASLALRDGEPDALAGYDRHGRLLDYPSTEDAITAAAHAAVADRLDGASVVVVAATNDQAATISARTRDELISLGLVEPDGGVLLGRDANTASVGDLIMCRRNDYRLDVTNRVQYRVLATPTAADTPAVTAEGLEDGALLVQAVPVPGRPQTGPVVLPAGYVAEDVQLGYAGTVHAAEGLTVDRAHLMSGPARQLDNPALYVAMTRGRHRNTAHVGLTATSEPNSAPAATTPRGGQVRIEATTSAPNARAVLETALTPEDGPEGLPQRPGPAVAATVAAEHAQAREASLATLTARLEAETRLACRIRTERHLDDLHHAGIIDAEVRAHLGADQATEFLSRLLRGVEQTGADPYATLAEAAATRGLADANSPAQVLAHRITTRRAAHHLVDEPVPGTRIPAGIPTEMTERLAHLHAAIDQRTAVLGAQTAVEAPPWAVLGLGPVPEATDVEDRADWERRAGLVAAHREATGYQHPTRALDRMPGLSSTERRSSYAAAWQALGRPRDALAEAGMSDGQLRARITAWRREQDWAPPHVDAQLRAAETARETARQQSAIAQARAEQADAAGQADLAEQLRTEAAEHREDAELKALVVAGLTQVSEARAAWYTASLTTRHHHDRALAEAERRGLDVDHDDDRTTTTDYLTDQPAVHAEDEHRPVSENDLATAAHGDATWNSATRHDTDHTQDLTERPTPKTLTPTSTMPNNATSNTVPAQARVPSRLELDVMVAATALALDRLADQASHDAAHADVEREAQAAEAEDAARRRRDAFDQQATSTGAHEDAADLTAGSDLA